MKRLKKPANYRPMITVENAKTSKGTKFGYLTGIMYLAPATEAGRGNLCQFASEACKSACLYTAGRGQFEKIRSQRIAKTHYFLDYNVDALNSLRYDIARLARRAKSLRLKLAIRINGTSDLPKYAMMLAREFPRVQFYDYTKLPKPYLRTLHNYHITFSYSGTNMQACMDALQNGVNVAVVFPQNQMPESYLGYRVVNGDTHDLRFLDKQSDGSAVIVGLKAKGKAKKDTLGFVVTPQLVNIQLAA